MDPALNEMAQLIDLTLIKSSFELFNSEALAKKGNLEFGISISFIEEESEESIKLKIGFDIKGSDSDGVAAFNNSAEYLVQFTSDNKAAFFEVDEPKRIVYCFTTCFPAIRKDLMHTFNIAGIRSIVIPYNMTIEKLQKQ